jgi:hypothetical protein
MDWKVKVRRLNLIMYVLVYVSVLFRPVSRLTFVKVA